jgi:sugar/nucleoside kinase (ribokinase family)
VTDPTYDVLAVGNAIFDVIAEVDDGFLDERGLTKDSMQLVEPERAEALYAAMPPGTETSGGSAANTAVGVAALGGSAAFIGKVRDDQLGAVYAHDIRAAGVDFAVAPAPEGPPTARSLIVVTPDAHRTMSTSLGIAGEVDTDDIDVDLVASAAVVYCEGYLWDREPTKDAIRLVMRVAREAGNKVALSLSDGFCVERHRSEFLALVRSSVDVLFANDAEIRSLYEVEHFDDALQHARRDCDLCFLTRGAAGAVVARGDDVHVVGAHPRGPVVDTTGAGDQFAAGALHGLSRGHDIAICARLGSLAAGEVISHIGPRPREDLKVLAGEMLSHASGVAALLPPHEGRPDAGASRAG